MTTLSVKKSAARVATGVGLLLVIPLLAKLVLKEMNWGVEDFLAAGVLLFGAGMVFSFVVPRIKTKLQKILVSVATFLTLVAIWAELAVGLFD